MCVPYIFLYILERILIYPYIYFKSTSHIFICPVKSSYISIYFSKGTFYISIWHSKDPYTSFNKFL